MPIIVLMSRFSPIRLASLEDYDADIEAELLASEAQNSAQTQLVQEALATNQALPDALRQSMEQAADAPDAAEAAEVINDHTHPMDIVDIRGRIQTVMDLSPRPTLHQRFNFQI